MIRFHQLSFITRTAHPFGMWCIPGVGAGLLRYTGNRMGNRFDYSIGGCTREITSPQGR
jgi:hypothetical protein